MLLYLFFDFLLSACQKKMETAKWPKAADFPLMVEIVDSAFRAVTDSLEIYTINYFIKKKSRLISLCLQFILGSVIKTKKKNFQHFFPKIIF